LPGRRWVLTILLALAAALGYGGSDFAAGLAARGASVIRITILAEAVSVVVLLLTVPWVSSQPPSLSSVTWSVVGGLSGVTGAMALYMGFRHAAFSVAAPVSAVASAGFSVLAGLAFGEHPTALSLAGIILALPAIVGVSVSSSGQASPAVSGTGPAGPGPEFPEEPGTTATAAVTAPAVVAGQPPAGAAGEPRGGSGAATTASTGRHGAGVLWGLIAGAGFGVLFIGLNQAGSGHDLWPLAIAQLAALILVAGFGAVRGHLRLPPRRAGWLAAITGVTGAAGSLCFFVATHQGLLAVTAVITSLYPASTILLARLLLGERLTAIRIAGLALAAASVALIAVGGAG
jgi:drug/metabolite transporter (DMT)-like permease